MSEEIPLIVNYFCPENCNCFNCCVYFQVLHNEICSCNEIYYECVNIQL